MIGLGKRLMVKAFLQELEANEEKVEGFISDELRRILKSAEVLEEIVNDAALKDQPAVRELCTNEYLAEVPKLLMARLVGKLREIGE